MLRNGKLVGTFATSELSYLELVTKMIGRSLNELQDMTKLKLESSHHIKKDELLEAKGLGRTGAIEPFDLELHAGEVVGLAGLLGSGRTEIAELLFGIERPDSGSISMDGKTISDYSPIESIGRGVALSAGPKSRGDHTGLNRERKYHPGYAS